MRFRRFLHGIGMPLTFAELGAKAEDIPQLVENIGIGNGTRAGFTTLTREDITRIYEIAVDPKLL